jgi:hypothetical protein
MGKDDKLQKFEIFERVATRIYQLLSPSCQVQHNAMLDGIDSGTKRQIDILIRGNIAGHEILMIVQCKNEKGNLDLNKIHEFQGVMKDVGANRGVIIAKKGFSKSALRAARRYGIDCCILHDAETKDWRLELKVPLILEEITPRLEFGFGVKLEKGATFDTTLERFQVGGVPIFKRFYDDWNSGKIKLDVSEDLYPLEIADPYIEDQNGVRYAITKFKMTYKINRKYFLGFVDKLPSSKAIKNLTSNSVELIFLWTDLLNYKGKDFIEYDSLEDIPFSKTAHIKSLMCPDINVSNFKGNFRAQKISD